MRATFIPATLVKAITALFLFLMLCLAAFLINTAVIRPATSQTAAPTPKGPRPLYNEAVTLLNRATDTVDESGPHLAMPFIHRAAIATRKWLEASGQMTPERAARLASLERLCADGDDTQECNAHTMISALIEIRQLLSIHLEGTTFYRANAALLEGRRAAEDLSRDPVQRAVATEAASARGVSILLEAMKRGPLNDGEKFLLGSNLAQALQSAYTSGNCAKAEPHADRLIAFARQFPEQGANYSPQTLGYTIKGACALWARDPAQARRYAVRALATEGEVSNHMRAQASLDLRARYGNARAVLGDPREIAAVATWLLWDRTAPAGRPALLADIIRWTSEQRASTLSDAILISRQAREGDPALRQAIDALLAANSGLDLARRDLRLGEPGAEARVEAAFAQLRRAEAGALRAGIDIPSSAASISEIRGALAPGEGFLFLYPTQFGGPIIWGVDEKGEAFLLPPGQRTRILIDDIGGMTPGSTMGSLLSQAPPANYFDGPSTGWNVRSHNGALAQDARATQRADKLAFRLRQLGVDYGPAFNAIKGRARYWAISHVEELDGLPLAEIPMLTLQESDTIRTTAGIGAPSAVTMYPLDRAMGHTIAYSIAPSPRAFVALGQQRQARSTGSIIPFVGIGDIPFLRSHCGVAQAPRERPGRAPFTFAARRTAILDQECLAESRAQLTAFNPVGGRGRLITGTDATEGSLTQFSGRDVRVLAFSTHGLASGNFLTGEAPALLLFPPVRDLGESNDGILTPIDAAKLGIRARLVVLSACSTGIEDGNLGEEPLSGMARGFFLGGARSVLVTRWELNAAYGVVANQAFADALRRGESRAEALRSARRALLTKNPRIRPWHWAVIELIGDGAPL